MEYAEIGGFKSAVKLLNSVSHDNDMMDYL